MPEGPGGSATAIDVFSTAVASVEGRLRQIGASPRRLADADLAQYPRRGFVAGWRIDVAFSDGNHGLELLLPVGFPWQPPRVALAEPPAFLTWPHVERDGLLCIAPNTLETDPDDPAGVVASLLGSACELVASLIAGNFDDEFRDEFSSYWDFAADLPAKGLISLVEPAPPSRVLRVWRGKDFYVVGETEDQLEKWLLNRFGSKPDGFKVDPAGFIWIGDPLVPRDYPSTGLDLSALAKRTDAVASAVLTDLVRAHLKKIVTMLGVKTVNGPALGGVIITPPAAVKHGARDPLTKGFRPGAVPDAILFARYVGGGKVSRSSVERADATWIHGRGQDPRTARLREASVTIVGCGSIGAPVAIALAQAGVGRIVLIDFDILTWANIGRHPLGAAHVGQYKSKALGEKLRSDFPHMTVEHYEVDIDTVIRKHAEALESSDLIISATGSWAADGRLEVWRAESDIPTVYAWTEAHACAGHSVLIGPGRGCLRCGFDNTGVPLFRVTAWPNGSPECREPACGAVYQPYGPVELGFINSLISELALDALLGKGATPLHRIWVASRERLTSLGGEWTAEWRRDAGFREEGGFTLARPWSEASRARCKKAIAA